MRHPAPLVLAFALALLPWSSQAAFVDFYTNVTELELGVLTPVGFYFDTDELPATGYRYEPWDTCGNPPFTPCLVPFPELGDGPGVLGFGGELEAIGSLTFEGVEGDHLLDELSTCLAAGKTTCRFIDDGRAARSGIEGTAVHMMTLMVLAREPGDGIRANYLQFVEGNFTTINVGPSVVAQAPLDSPPPPWGPGSTSGAEPVPEPDGTLLFTLGLGIAAWRLRTIVG